MNNEEQRGFKGVWIPREIWLDDKLTWMEKLFLTEINSLDNEEGCFASNTYFAKFFKLTQGRCSQIINSLIKKEYVKVQYIREGKEIKKRVLNILNRGIKNIKEGYIENAEESNTKSNNTNKKEDDRLKPYLPLSKLLYTEHKKVDDKYLNGNNVDNVCLKWANDIRLLVEKDGRTIAEIEQVIRWVKTEGNFWFVNIMSGKKLRLQFPKLLLQMKQEGKKPGSFKGTDEELHSYDEFFGGNK